MRIIIKAPGLPNVALDGDMFGLGVFHDAKTNEALPGISIRTVSGSSIQVEFSMQHLDVLERGIALIRKELVDIANGKDPKTIEKIIVEEDEPIKGTVH